MEAAGLGLAFLPVLLAAVKGHGVIAETFHNFKKCPREVKLIEVQFLSHRAIFENECRFLLHLVEEDRKLPGEMLADTRHKSWISVTLEHKLNRVLKAQLPICTSLIEAISMTIEEMGKELIGLRCISSKCKKGETIRQTIHRLKKSMSVAFDRGRYDKLMKSLSEYTKNLASLRKQLFKLQSPGNYQSSGITKKLPKKYEDIRSASQSLQQTLREAWWCDSPQHQRHIAKLRIEVESAKELRLDLAITCQKEPRHSGMKSDVDSPIWLYVRNSVSPDTTQSATSMQRTDDINHKNKHTQEQAGPCLRPEKDQETDCGSRKRRKVEFNSPGDGHAGGSDQDGHWPSSLSTLTNLCLHRNLCSLFNRRRQRNSVSLEPEGCIGYLESSNKDRHMFFLAECHPKLRTQRTTALEIVPLPAFIEKLDGNSTSVVEQYKLAHRTALAVLQYHSTPWMNREWHLSDLSLFQDCLETLHLSAEIPDAANIAAQDGGDATVDTTTRSRQFNASAERKYGVNNMTLLCLGMVLLQIEFWKPIEQLRIEEDEGFDVITARRLAEREARLGLRYRTIVRRCLQCDFGVGNDLSKSGLQNAVYGHVVCELEEMIEGLTRLDL